MSGMNLMDWHDAVGLAAPALFLYAYAMVTLGRWQPNTLRFHALNFIGAAAILISLATHWNLAVCILESCWAAISAIGMVRALRRRHPSSL